MLMFYDYSNKVIVNCKSNNYMSGININSSNKYETRRELPLAAKTVAANT